VENSAENTQDTAVDDLLLADSPEDDDPILEEPAPPRQGLPPGFRMRHDRHYVDELMGRRVAPAPRPVPRAEEPAPAIPAASERTSDNSSRALHAALAAIADRLDAVTEHARAGRRGALPSFDRALQMELDRAARLARAASALSGEVAIARREVTAGDIAARALRAVAQLRRFSGVRFDTSIEGEDVRLAIDASAATQAVTCALEAFSGLLGSSGDREDDEPVIRLEMKAVQPRPALMIEVSAHGVQVTEEAVERFFEPAAAGTDPEASILLGAAAKIARAHGGRADARRGADGSIVALLVLPQ
jgi:hypothetical protein